MNVANTLVTGSKAILTLASKHMPEILSGMELLGVGTTGVLAAKGWKKACEDMEKEESTWEKVKVAIADLAPAVISGAATCACIVANNATSHKRIVALASAYALSKNNLDDYRDKMREVLGEKKMEKVEKEMAKERFKEADEYNKRNNIVIVGDGKIKCMEYWTGTMFYSNVKEINIAESNVNADLYRNEYVCLNDFFDYIGIQKIPVGDMIGWNVDQGPFTLEYLSDLDDCCEPTLVIKARSEPVYGFDDTFRPIKG